MSTDPTALPPERLGELLHQARRKTSLGRRRAAKAAELRDRELAAIEKGKATPDRPTIDKLLDAYDITVDQLIPPRKPFKLGGSGGSDANCAGQLPEGTSRDDVLTAYIAMIVNARAAGRLDAFSLRADDVQVLASALDTDDDVLIDRIAKLIGCDRDEAAWLSRRLRAYAGPIAGVAFGIAVVAGSAMASNTSGATLAPASSDAQQTHMVAHAQAPTPASDNVNGQAG